MRPDRVIACSGATCSGRNGYDRRRPCAAAPAVPWRARQAAARSRSSPRVLAGAAAGRGRGRPGVPGNPSGLGADQDDAPKPLPASVVSVSGQSLVPAAAALAIAALASLAAVLATRRTARRVAGLLLAGFGAGIAASVSAGISAADVLAAGAGNAAAAAGSGTGASSVTSGAPASGGTSAGTSPIAGFAGHVVLALFPWRGLAIAGALIVVVAGLLVAWRGTRWPVMSSRYDLPSRGSAPGAPPGPPVAAASRALPDADSASVWESLSRGDDPTA